MNTLANKKKGWRGAAMLLVSVLLGGSMALVGATAANATHPSVSGSAPCAPGDITWTVSGDANYRDATGTIVSQSRTTSPSLIGKTVKGNQSVTATEAITEPGTYNLEVKVQWNTHAKGDLVSQSGSVKVKNCELPRDASASVSVTPPTCEAPATLVYGAIQNAAFSGTANGTAGPGSYSVTATAVAKHLFADGQSTKVFTGTLSGKLPEQSNDPHGPCYVPVVHEPKVVTSEWTDGAWDCDDTSVTQTRTVTTTYFKLVKVDGKWTSVEDPTKTTVVTETQTRPLTPEEIESCKPSPPNPTPTVSEWTDSEWDCDDTTVTQTRTITYVPYVMVYKDGVWTAKADPANSWTIVEEGSRELTDEEIESCKPEIPAPVVTSTDWKDGKWDCDDTTVTQTRTVTTKTTDYVLKDRVWEKVEATSSATETQTRALKDTEKTVCPAVVTPPKQIPAKPVVKATLPETGSDLNPAIFLMVGAALMGLGATAVVAAKRRKTINGSSN